MNPSLPAVIAAAGLSRRMGMPKALLEAQGVTFLARVTRALRDGGATPVHVALKALDGTEARVAEEEGAVPLLNPYPDPGPISSLQTGIRALDDDAMGVVFTPVDHPLFRPGTVRALIREFLTHRPPLAAPSFQGRNGHPVIFSRGLFPELLEEDLPQGARTVVGRYLQERLVLPVDDPGILADIDTPEEYRRNFPGKP